MGSGTRPVQKKIIKKTTTVCSGVLTHSSSPDTTNMYPFPHQPPTIFFVTHHPSTKRSKTAEFGPLPFCLPPNITTVLAGCAPLLIPLRPLCLRLCAPSFKRYPFLKYSELVPLPLFDRRFLFYPAQPPFPRPSGYFCVFILMPPVLAFFLPPLDPEALFLDVIGTKVLRVFLLAIYSHLY